MTIACHECNQKKGNMTAVEFGHPEIQIQARQSLKAATFMNVARSRLVDNIKKSFPGYMLIVYMVMSRNIIGLN